MNKHAMTLAVCLTLQPVVALGAETMSLERRPQYSNPADPMTEARGRTPKVTAAQNPPKGMAPAPGDAIERGKQRAAAERARQEQAFVEAIDRAVKKEKKCGAKICPIGPVSD